MKEMSNSTLALMVVGAILVSIIGSFISLTKLSEVGTTGFATSDQGKANLSVSSTADIILLDDLIELGEIAHGASNDSDVVNDYWILNNKGGVNVSIQIYQTSGGTGGGTTYNGQLGFGPFTTEGAEQGCVSSNDHTCFLIQCDSTDSGSDCNTTEWYQLPPDVGSSGYYVFDLDYHDTADNATFGVNVTVPLDEPSGNKVQYVVFAGTCTDEDAGC